LLFLTFIFLSFSSSAAAVSKQSKSMLEIHALSALNNPFTSGQDFASISPSDFYVDKSGFIPLLETKLFEGSRAVVSLRPPRFGKTLQLSLLSYYYDIANRDRLQQLFGHLEIGKSGFTEHAASCLVLELNFSALNMNTYEEFERSFNQQNNEGLNEFLFKYSSKFNNIKKRSDFDVTADFVRNFLNMVDELATMKQKVW
jgi:hypothetical protein